MRTTINLDDELYRTARIVAARTGRTLTQVFEDALRESFARSAGAPRRPVEIPTFKGNGTLPGIDLDDTSVLLEQVERPHARP